MVREWSTASALRRLTDLAARAVPGCAGATCSGGIPDEDVDPVLRAASRPELAELVDLQLAQAEGPELEAKRAKRRSAVTTPSPRPGGPRWSRRCSAGGSAPSTRPSTRADQTLVTLTLYGVLPGVLDVRSGAGLAAGRSGRRGALQHPAVRRGPADRRPAPGGGRRPRRRRPGQGHPDEPVRVRRGPGFRRTPRISQTRHVKLTVLARRIVSSQGLKP